MIHQFCDQEFAVDWLISNHAGTKNFTFIENPASNWKAVSSALHINLTSFAYKTQHRDRREEKLNFSHPYFSFLTDFLKFIWFDSNPVPELHIVFLVIVLSPI